MVHLGNNAKLFVDSSDDPTLIYKPKEALLEYDELLIAYM